MDIEESPSCKHCGMNREMFSHSRMLIEYDDGSKTGTCSLHCTAVDLVLNLDKKPRAILVGDYFTKQLIDAETATWVIGEKQTGVMTKNAKWAFASKEDAEKFRQQNGGTLAGFDEALDAAYRDISNDTKMIREKRCPGLLYDWIGDADRDCVRRRIATSFAIGKGQVSRVRDVCRQIP